MRAGAMDRRIELLAEQETGRTDSGQRTVAWLPFARVWAERRELRGSEQITNVQTAAKIECVYRIRYREDVFPEQRLRDANGRVYNIKACPEIGRREGLELFAEARAEELRA